MVRLRRWMTPVIALLLTAVAACGPRAVSPGSSPAAGSPLASTSASPSTEVDISAVEEFYRGKTIRLLVGFSPGGGYDTVARLLARHLPRHIPGNPSVVVENMPGASGLIAANYTFHQAPKDGTTLLLFAESALRDELVGSEGVQFKSREYLWLGSTQVQTSLCFARTDSGVSSLRDVIGGSRQLIVGSTGPGSNLHDFPATLRAALNANIRLVPGYPGSSDVLLAMESGELNAACVPWESIKVTRPQWFTGAAPFATILVQQGAEKHPDLAHVPLAEELAQTEEQRQLIRVATSTLSISKPLVAPPGVPADRVTALRRAFDALLQDPELLREAEAAKVDLSPKSWDRVSAIVEQVLSAPPDVISRLKMIYEAG